MTNAFFECSLPACRDHILGWGVWEEKGFNLGNLVSVLCLTDKIAARAHILDFVCMQTSMNVLFGAGQFKS